MLQKGPGSDCLRVGHFVYITTLLGQVCTTAEVSCNFVISWKCSLFFVCWD